MSREGPPVDLAAFSRVRALSASGDDSRAYGLLLEEWERHGYAYSEPFVESRRALARKGRPRELRRVLLARTIPGHEREVRSIDLDPKGRRMLSRSWDRVLRVWDVRTWECICSLPWGPHEITAAVLLPDGRRALLGTDEGLLLIWTLEDGVSSEWARVDGYIHDIRVMPCRRRVLSVGDTCVVLELETARPAWSFPCLGSHRLVSPDGRHLIKAVGQLVSVMDIDGQMSRGFGGVSAQSLSPEGLRLATCETDTIRVREMEKGRVVLELRARPATTVSFLPDGRLLASGAMDGSLGIWDLELARSAAVVEGGPSAIECLAVAPDGGSVITGDQSGALRHWLVVREMDFPAQAEWDEAVRPYLDVFIAREGHEWGEEQFLRLIEELSVCHGLGWVRAAGVLRALG